MKPDRPSSAAIFTSAGLPASLQSGFTFIEVIASLALLGILTAIFGMGLVAAVESFYFGRTNVEVAQKGQMAMRRIIRELSETTAIHQADGGAVVYDRIEDVSGIPTTRRLGMYRTATGRLMLYSDVPAGVTLTTADSAGDLLLNEVQVFSLAYHKGAESWIYGEDPQLLSTIHITLTLNRADDPAHPHQFTTLVHLRNTGNTGGAAP